MQRSLRDLFFSTVIVLGGLQVVSAAPPPREHAGVDNLVIDNIVCRGNETTQCEFITKKYYQQKGDVLDPEEVADAELRLGTLIQFRDVNIHLEKGQQRGHVIVVIEVLEASNIQFTVGLDVGRSVSEREPTSPSGLNDVTVEGGKSSNRADIRALFGSVTNYNFLGLAKELTFSASVAGIDQELTDPRTVTRSTEDSSLFFEQPRFESSTETTEYSLSLGYYDPHLLGSLAYYGRIEFDHQKQRADSHSTRYGFGASGRSNEIVERGETQIRARSRSQTLTLGRRFARFSSVSLAYRRRAYSIDRDSEFAQDGDIDSYILEYARDTRNDAIFPTRGTAFNAAYIADDISDNALSADARAHIAVAGSLVLNLSASAQYRDYGKADRAEDDTRSPSSSGGTRSLETSVGITGLRRLDPKEGRYAGWKTTLSVRGAEQELDGVDDVRNDSARLTLEYIYQSNTFVTRFSLFYEEGGQWF